VEEESDGIGKEPDTDRRSRASGPLFIH